MSDVNNTADDAWQLELNNLENRYYKLRSKLYNNVERYYRMNPYGSYITEDTLVETMRELKSMREKMIEISSNPQYRLENKINVSYFAVPRYGVL